jgi:hypothetical protein
MAYRAFLACMLACLSTAQSAAPPEKVAVRKDGAGFVLTPSGAPFTPWGFNQDRDYQHRLLEDYWSAEWATVEQDFREMKQLGANLVRIDLQFARFMDAPGKPNPANLARLEKLVQFAESLGLYLDITGLGSYREKDIPAWYGAMPEGARWAAQAQFWEAIAKTCAGRPGVFGDRRPGAAQSAQTGGRGRIPTVENRTGSGLPRRSHVPGKGQAGHGHRHSHPL